MNDNSASDLKSEWLIVRRQLFGVGAAAAALLTGGAVFFHFVEKFSWVDAFYFCTVSLTTVGYGDVVPTTDGGKIFTIFYILVGIGILATFANLIIKNTMLRREYKRALRSKSKLTKS